MAYQFKDGVVKRMSDIIHRHYWLWDAESPRVASKGGARHIYIGHHPEGKSIGYVCVPDPEPEGDAKWIAIADGEDIGDAWLSRYFMTEERAIEHVMESYRLMVTAQRQEVERALLEMRWR